MCVVCHPLQFPPETYEEEMAQYVGLPKEEVVALLRRGSISFSRGSSRFKGVSRHHKHRKWEARIGGAGPDSR